MSLNEIVELQETTNVEEVNDWISYIGVRLLSVEQDPYGRAHYVIGRTAENERVPWDEGEA
jgi:hypothetical protein